MVAAIAALISAGVGIGGLALNASRGSGGAPQQAFQQNESALLDSRNNQAYVRALNALGLKQSTAGFTDAQGGTIQYDPATNQWITTASPGQAAATKSQQDATIARNTIDMDAARRANTRADARALAADRATGPALAAIENYQPITGTTLAGLLTDRATQANADTFRPIVQDTVQNATRTGTSADRIISALGKTQAQENRNAITDATIAGYTGAPAINKANLDNLRSTYATVSGRADPTLQFPGIAADDSSKTLAAIAADRAKTAAGVTTGAGYVNNQSQGLLNQASDKVAGSVPGDVLGQSLVGLGNVLSPERVSAIGKGFTSLRKSGFFGSDTPQDFREEGQDFSEE